MERDIELRLEDKSISDLKAILEVCEKKGKTDMKWVERSEWVKEVLLWKIENIFM